MARGAARDSTRGAGTRGAVVIVALAVIALLSIFAISFASLVKLERAASMNYVDGVRARQLLAARDRRPGRVWRLEAELRADVLELATRGVKIDLDALLELATIHAPVDPTAVESEGARPEPADATRPLPPPDLVAS